MALVALKKIVEKVEKKIVLQEPFSTPKKNAQILGDHAIGLNFSEQRILFFY